MSLEGGNAAALRVAMLATEAWPYAKTGGLADVTSALSAALAAGGAQVLLVVPGYAGTSRERFAFEKLRLAEPIRVPVGPRHEPVDAELGRLPASGVPLLAIRHPGYFERSGIYFDPRTGVEFEDAAERFAYFSRAALSVLVAINRVPDILHLNDYHTALAAAYARVDDTLQQPFSRTATVFSIHNLGYQGLFGSEVFGRLGLPLSFRQPLGPLEFWGRLNFMKAGILLSDVLTTVSPTYAREIQDSQEYGLGLEGVLRERRDRLFGILNGIDVQEWDPARDQAIPARYDLNDLSGKRECKRQLQARLGLPVDSQVPVFGVISRLAAQKGFDVLFRIAPQLAAMRLQIVVLGTGQPEYERRLLELAARHPEQFAVQIEFNDPLAHWIEAGSDFFLMPSRYEPCGLNQMYSQRYGTVPVVRATGGLADSVLDWKPETGVGTGFLYREQTPEALLGAIRRALEAFAHADVMRQLITQGMREDFSWARSARRYEEIYRVAVARRMAPPTEPSNSQAGAPEGRGH